MINKNLEAWSLKNTVDFYVRERTHAADLYKSEAAMLLPVIRHIKSMLDVGCAVGNFSSIINELNPGVSYVGIDTSKGMIEEARRRYPKIEFHLGEQAGIPFGENSFDMAFCTGVLNHNPDYLDMIADMLRVAKDYVIVDLPRLVMKPYNFDMAHSYMVLKERFSSTGGEVAVADTKVPYVLASVGDFFANFVKRFSDGLCGFACHGYYGTPHQSVTIPISPVIFTVVLMVKGRGPTRYHLELPGEAIEVAEEIFSAIGGKRVASVEEVIDGESK